MSPIVRTEQQLHPEQAARQETAPPLSVSPLRVEWPAGDVRVPAAIPLPWQPSVRGWRRLPQLAELCQGSVARKSAPQTRPESGHQPHTAG